MDASSSSSRRRSERKDSTSSHTEGRKYEKELDKMMKKKNMSLNIVEGQGGYDLIVHQVFDEDTVEVFAWATADSDAPEYKETACEEACKILKTLDQPIKDKLKIEDRVAELRFFARKERFELHWLISKNTPYKHKFCLLDPNEKRHDTQIHSSESEALEEAKIWLEKKCGKEFKSNLRQKAERLVKKRNELFRKDWEVVKPNAEPKAKDMPNSTRRK